MLLITAKYHAALAMLLLNACAPVLSVQADRNGDTVYRNSAGQGIVLSADHLIVTGQPSESSNCSTGAMQCWSFGKNIAFLAPVKCSDDVISGWSASGYTVLLKAVVPYTDRILLRMQDDNEMQYVYGKDDGVSEIYYDPSGAIADAARWDQMSFDDKQGKRCSEPTLLKAAG